MSGLEDATGIRGRRGPGYPNLDLETAIARAEELYQLSARAPIPLVAAAEKWGYTARSSNTLRNAAALKRFGLISDVGDGTRRMVQLTDFGRRLLVLAKDQSSPEWQSAVREAALQPKIYRELLQHFDGVLPADRAIEHHLILERGFSDESARDLIKKLRSTVRFAGIREIQGEKTPADTLGLEDAHGGSVGHAAGGGRRIVTAARAYGGSPLGDAAEPSAQGRAVQIPYSTGRWARLEAEFPMTEDEWHSMLTVLNAMKSGLVKAESTRDATPEWE